MIVSQRIIFWLKKKYFQRVLLGFKTLRILVAISLIGPKTEEEVQKNSPNNPRENTLANLFTEYGSDKAIMHDYWKLYEPELDSISSENIRILEIGLGTNNPNIPSNMGGNFVPCGSLRAFRKFLKDAEIYGADIDKDILISEERIKTCWVDQLNQRSFKDILEMIDYKGLDMVIVDGLHQPYADLVSVLRTLPYLKKRGTFFVEDIENSRIVRFFWQICFLVLPRRYVAQMIPMKGGLVFKIERKR